MTLWLFLSPLAGESWLTPSELGVCAYNCTIRYAPDGTFCTQAEKENNECVFTCDPRSY
jgi:hypothetical protein